MRRTKDLKCKLLGLTGVIMMMCFMFVHFSMVTLAAEGKITASSVKIRKEASTSSDVVGGATQNQVFTITGETTGADGYVWYKVTFEGNKSGYIRSDLIQKTDGATATPQPSTGGTTLNPTVTVTDVQPVSATITGASVRVRSDASTNGGIITNVVRDVVVTITGQAKDELGNTWYLVSYSSDNGEVKGFIREDFLSVSGTITPVEGAPSTETPPADTPSVNDPVVDTPITTVNDYEVVNEDGVWYLVDNKEGFKYNAQQMITAIKENQTLLQSYQDKIDSQKKLVVVLVIAVILLGIVATLLFLKVKDVMDEAYFTAVEKETIRQRQGQKANNSSNANKNKSVMQTVGAGPNTATKQNVNKQNGNKQNTNNRPVAKNTQQRPAGTAPQTVKVSNPADTRVKPVQKTGEQVRPAEQKPVMPKAPVQKAAEELVVKKPVETVAQPKETVAPVETVKKPAETAPKQSWQSKNFMAEDDDDLEFEFLNWDGNEEK